MAGWLKPLRLFPTKFTDLDRFWKEAAVYVNTVLKTTATTTNASYKLAYEG